MKILYVVFKNFIGFYNGMDLKNIELDFKDSKNKFILIAGSNGSGKSTLLENLHWYPNLSDEKIIRKGKKGYKEIHYSHNELIYIIKHFYEPKKDTHSCKSYITKIDGSSEVELNPNGNVTSFNEIIESEFGIDQNFVRLTRLSNEMNGLIDMTATKRKDYMSKFTNMANIYLRYHKKINDECRQFRNIIKNLADKLDKFDDKQDIKEELEFVEKNINKFGLERDALLTTISSMKGELNALDPNNNIQQTYYTMKNRIEYLEKYINSNNIDTSISIDMLKNKVNKLYTELAIVNNQFDNVQKLNVTKLNEKTDIQNKQTELEIELSKYSSNDNIIEIENMIKNYTDTANQYALRLQNLSFVPDISKNEIMTIYNIMEQVNSINDIINGEFNNHILDLYMSMDSSEIKQKYLVYLNEIKEMETQLVNMDNNINSMSNKINELKELLNKRPSKCDIDDCPFICNAISQISNIASFDEQNKIREQLAKSIDKLKRDNIYEDLIKIDKFVNDILTLIKQNKLLLENLPETKELLNIDKLLKKIKTHKKLVDINKIQEYISISEDVSTYNDLKIKVNMLKVDYIKLKNDANITAKLNKEITHNKKLYNDILKELDSLNHVMSECTNIKNKLKEEYDSYSDKTKLYITYNDYINELNDLKTNIKKYQETITIILKHKEFITENSNKLDYLQNSLNEFLNKRDKLKYQYKLVKQYTKEKSIYDNQFKELEILRNALSNKNGIPVIFVKIFLQKTKILANRMLENAFDGKLLLDDFDINEKEFRIPCHGKGERHADASTASSGERALISLSISLAMLKQQMKSYGTTEQYNKYGILELDELDGPLDNKHRKLFVNLLEKSCNDMNMEQIFMISHNDTFVNYDVSYILFKGHNKEVVDRSNIIFEY